MVTSIDPTLVEAAVEAAIRVRTRAHAPYSGFLVGSAVVDADGGIHVGCNVENVSYGLTQCAERSAVTAAVASGRTDLVLCVVVTDTDQPATPCGACRQVLAEFDRSMPILCTTPRRIDAWYSLATLLPDSFDGTSLRR